MVLTDMTSISKCNKQKADKNDTFEIEIKIVQS